MLQQSSTLLWYIILLQKVSARRIISGDHNRLSHVMQNFGELEIPIHSQTN